MLNGIKILIVCCFTLSLVSCNIASISNPSQNVDLTKSRFLVYSYSDSTSIPDYSFYINKISFKKISGDWVDIALIPFKLNTLKLLNNQEHIGEFFIDPSVYSGFRITINNVEDAGGNSLSVYGGGTLDFDYEVTSTPTSTHLINLNWDFTIDTFSGGVFKPLVSIRPDELSASELLLFVSNSGSNYITVLDGYKGLAIGAVTVGMEPKGIVLNTEGSRLYVLNSQDATVSVVDPDNLTVLSTISVSSGTDPVDMVFAPEREGSPEGKLYITNNGSRNITVARVEPNALLGNIEVGLGPKDIEIDRVRREVYVVNKGSNELSVIDILNDKEVARIPVCDDPESVVSGGGGDVYVYCPSVGIVDKVTLASMSVVDKRILDVSMSKGLHVEGYFGFYSTDRSLGKVYILDNLGAIISEVSVGVEPYDMTYDDNLSKLYVANYGGDTITVLNLISNIAEKTVTVGSRPYGIVSYRQRDR